VLVAENLVINLLLKQSIFVLLLGLVATWGSFVYYMYNLNNNI